MALSTFFTIFHYFSLFFRQLFERFRIGQAGQRFEELKEEIIGGR
jgi:hypothetical protein